ncbi:hypothetical protein [Planctomicrobium piriforme]|uniref:Uncharacterized protein n=1 Tax=Planctomicrobium piriforme TaxID=1576369 RepID=A0A1I3TIZ2_9PLAN|nr:hypothetical protein [Planctomicrobium piriforme]SFJ69497.1 hypothetical protein SAMN05421753_1303 [Planctomicrobium piriforme]
MTIVDRAVDFSYMFEAEVLVELMMRNWSHPRMGNRNYRNELLERVKEALDQAQTGMQLLEELPAVETNFLAAVWYVEWMALSSAPWEIPKEEIEGRTAWVETVRRVLPSCFMRQDDLA